MISSYTVLSTASTVHVVLVEKHTLRHLVRQLESKKNFKWLKGESLLSNFESSPGKKRYFCSCCGSQLIKTKHGSSMLVLRIATLDDNPKQKPKYKIWASHEVPWLKHDIDLPAYNEWNADE